MRVLIALASIVASCSSGLAQTNAHKYTKADRYAGCLVGYLMPALHRGSSHDKAMASAADSCFLLSKDLSERDVREAVDEVNRFLERADR